MYDYDRRILALEFELAHVRLARAAAKTAVAIDRFQMGWFPPDYLAEVAASEHMGETPPSLEVYLSEKGDRP